MNLSDPKQPGMGFYLLNSSLVTSAWHNLGPGREKTVKSKKLGTILGSHREFLFSVVGSLPH